MSTTYNIILQNDHGIDGNYALFSSPPQVSTTGVTPQVYTNAWITQYVSTGGNMTVTTGVDFYAWAGSVPSSPAQGVVMQTGTSALAQLGAGGANGSAFPMTILNGTPKLGTPTPTAKVGAFEIDTDASFPSPNSTWLIGLGKVDTRGIVSPVAAVLADNQTNTTITPIMKFYIGAYAFKAGSIVDFSSVVKTCGLIDFSSGPGLGMFTAVVRHDQYGNFTTTYFPSAAAAQVMRSLRAGTLGEFMAEESGSDEQKLLQVQSLVERLAVLLRHMHLSSPASAAANGYEWVGLVGWPVVAGLATITAGVGMITAYMTARGYKVTYETVTNEDRTKITKFYVGPGQAFSEDLGFGYGAIQQDWNAAVNADTQNDGHINKGITRASVQASSRSNIAEKLTEQFKHALTQGLGEDAKPSQSYEAQDGFSGNYSNGLSNGLSKGFSRGFGSNNFQGIAT